MANSIAYTKNYTSILDEVCKRAACSTCLNSPRRMARAGRNAKEIMIPKIQILGLGDYARNVGYKTGSITYEFETKTLNHDRGIRLLADVMDVEEGFSGAEAEDVLASLRAATNAMDEVGGDDQLAHYVHHPHAQGRARALQPRGGGAADAVLLGNHAELRRVRARGACPRTTSS